MVTYASSSLIRSTTIFIEDISILVDKEFDSRLYRADREQVLGILDMSKGRIVDPIGSKNQGYFGGIFYSSLEKGEKSLKEPSTTF